MKYEKYFMSKRLIKKRKNGKEIKMPVNVVHNSHVSRLKQERDKKIEYIGELHNVKSNIEEIERKRINERCDEDFVNLLKLKKNKSELEIMISHIDTCDDLHNYFVNTKDYVYENIGQEIKIVTWHKKMSKQFEKEQKDEDLKYHEFMSHIDDRYRERCIRYDKNYIECPNCDVMLETDDEHATMVCHKCGYMQQLLTDPQRPVYDENIVETSSNSYRCRSHLDDVLINAQAKESVMIPEEVYDVIKMELKKNSITNMVNLTEKKCREYLKRNGLSKYYDHINLIIKHLEGINPLSLTPDIENTLNRYFTIVEHAYNVLKQDPSSTVAKTKRKSFLHYKSVINQLCVMLNYDESIIQHFPLLKSSKNLPTFFEIWVELCRFLEKDYPEFKYVYKYCDEHPIKGYVFNIHKLHKDNEKLLKNRRKMFNSFKIISK